MHQNCSEAELDQSYVYVLELKTRTIALLDDDERRVELIRYLKALLVC